MNSAAVAGATHVSTPCRGRLCGSGLSPASLAMLAMPCLACPSRPTHSAHALVPTSLIAIPIPTRPTPLLAFLATSSVGNANRVRVLERRHFCNTTTHQTPSTHSYHHHLAPFAALPSTVIPALDLSGCLRSFPLPCLPLVSYEGLPPRLAISISPSHPYAAC